MASNALSELSALSSYRPEGGAAGGTAPGAPHPRRQRGGRGHHDPARRLQPSRPHRRRGPQHAVGLPGRCVPRTCVRGHGPCCGGCRGGGWSMTPGSARRAPSVRPIRHHSSSTLKHHPHRTDIPSKPQNDRRNPVTTISTEAANFSWLLDNFVRSVPGVRHTLVVSADGLLMAMSDELDRTSGDQLGGHRLRHVEPDPWRRAPAPCGRGASGDHRDGHDVPLPHERLGRLRPGRGRGRPRCDVGLIGYEMAMLVSRTEATLTPQLVSEMRSRLPIDGATRAPAVG